MIEICYSYADHSCDAAVQWPLGQGFQLKIRQERCKPHNQHKWPWCRHRLNKERRQDIQEVLKRNSYQEQDGDDDAYEKLQRLVVIESVKKKVDEFISLDEQSAASTKEVEDIIDNIKKQSKLIHEAIKSTMEVFKRNKGLAEKVSDVAEVSDRIEEVSANSREVLVTMDEFTQHVSNLRDIPSHLKSETDKLKVEG